MPLRGCSLPRSLRRCSFRTGQILYGGALSKPITYGRLRLLREFLGLDGSIAISGRFVAGTSIQVAESSRNRLFSSVETRVRTSRLSRHPGPSSLSPKREGWSAERWGASGSCQVATARRRAPMPRNWRVRGISSGRSGRRFSRAPT